ncbi:MAG: hypothetical protein JJ974_03895 [Phycisphaerales bacterium]|nr:hypothetical protein [Phycisphaerales bacterium]
MKKLLIVFLVLILLVCAGVGVVYFKFFYTPPLNEAERALLTPDWDRATGGNWSPWYEFDDGTREWNPTKSFNAWLATYPEEDKAWPILIDAKLEFSDVYDNERFIEFSEVLPSDPIRWEILVPILESEHAQDLSSVLQEALSKPILGCEMMNTDDPHTIAAMQRHGIEVDMNIPVTENLAVVDSLLPAMGVLRGSARFLTGQAALALSTDDPDTFVKQLRSASQAGQLSDEYPTLIGELVRAAINSLVNRTIRWALEEHPDRLDEEHLEQLRRITAASAEPSNGFYGELLLFHDITRRIVSKTGKLTPTSISMISEWSNGTGFLFPDPVHIPDENLGSSARRTLLLYKDFLDQCRDESQPRPEYGWQLDEYNFHFVERIADELGFIPKTILHVLIPASGKASTRVLQHTQETIATNLALNLHIHKHRHGSFPTTLDDLDPDLQTLDPIDVFTGQPLLYTLTDTGPLIYSVGDDRDDDGGKIRWEINDAGPDDNIVEIRSPLPPEWIRTKDLQQRIADDPDFIDGDWVLFPIPFEDPAPLDDAELEIFNTP